MGTIKTALQAVHQRITQAATAAGRSPESVHLLAVSKTFPAECVHEAYEAGQSAFGENYVQEAVEKIAALAGASLTHPDDTEADKRRSQLANASEPGVEPGTDCQLSGIASPPAGPLLLPLEWHMIGPLQSNKTKLVAEHFDWVHSIERLKIAERLSAQRPAHLPPLQVCIQVNVSGEASKSGCALDEVRALATALSGLPGLRLRGLMCIPEPSSDGARLRAQFRAVRECFEALNDKGFALDTLSMGMSADLELAIAEGATIVRVGTAIFGARSRPTP